MKKFKILNILSILLFQNVFAQSDSVAKISIFEHRINRDITMMDNFYNNSFFIVTPAYRILGVDTLPSLFFKNDTNYSHSIEFYKVYVELNTTYIHHILKNERNQELKMDTLVYYFLHSNSSSSYYELFGFFSSNMGTFLNYHTYKQLKELSFELVRQKILTKSGARLFRQCLKNKAKEYPTKLNKPSEILKLCFNEKEKYRSNTIIKPSNLLKSYRR